MVLPTIFMSNYFLLLTEKNEDIIVMLFILFTKFSKSTEQVGSVSCKAFILSMYLFLQFSF
jgi:hypothetical protein